MPRTNPQNSLTIHPTTKITDQTTALNLIADSIAQQQQQAAKHILTHRLSWAILLTSMGSLFGILVYNDKADWATVGTTIMGCVMAGLAFVRWVVCGYLDVAERTGTWEWLYSRDLSSTGELRGKTRRDWVDTVLVMKFNDDTTIIGTVVLRTISSLSSSSSSSSTTKTPTTVTTTTKQKQKATTKIRAWTIHTHYRGRKLGTALLDYAVKYTHEQNWDGPVFDGHHANSVRLVPRFFSPSTSTTTGEGEEDWARRVLADVVSRNLKESGGINTSTTTSTQC